jgi:hypothetical protein
VKERLAWIVWPAFLVAIPGVGVVFSVFDPAEMDWPWGGAPDRLAAYTLGFLFLWLLGACSSALTCLLAKSPYERNRCPLAPESRPPGCPKRAAGPCQDA